MLNNYPLKKYLALISINIIIFYALYDWYQGSINSDQLIISIQKTPNTPIFIGLLISIITLILYGIRLNLLSKQKIVNSFAIVSIGFGANNLLPFRLGDILKYFLAKKYFKMSITKLLLINITEKFFDLVLIFSIGCAAVIIGTADSKPLYPLSLLLLLFCITIPSIIWLHQRDNNFIKKILQYKFILKISDAFSNILKNPNLIHSFTTTIIIWLLTIIMIKVYYTLALPQTLAWHDALALVFITALSLGIPSSPGAIGIFEAAVSYYLISQLGIDNEKALASAIVLHILIILPQIFFMLFFIIKKAIIKNINSFDEN
jgi:hypothetical protein